MINFVKFVSILLLFMLFFACKKQEIKEIEIIEPDPTETGELEIFSSGSEFYGFVEGTKTIGNGTNGKFRASSRGLLSEHSNQGFFILDFATFRLDGNQDEVILDYCSFEDIPLKKGKFNITNDEHIPKDNLISTSYSRKDGDISFANYKINLAKKNCIEITAVDTVAKTVKGKFSVYFNKTTKNDSSNLKYPLRVSFTDMKFETKLIKF
jgi:hypothetical protein